MKKELYILVVIFLSGINHAMCQPGNWRFAEAMSPYHTDQPEHHKIQNIDASDSITFDLSGATCSGINIDIPVSFFSDDEIYAVDFAMKFDLSKMQFDSIINDKSNLLSAANYNVNDSTLRFSSFSMQQLINDSPVVAIRFHLLAGQVGAADFNTVTTWLNGDVCSYKISNALPALVISTPNGIIVAPGDSINLIAASGSGFTWSWSTGESTQSINVHDSGTYIVTVTTTGGCLYTDAASVIMAAPLPVELTVFSVSDKHDGLLISWTTASEINNDYFTIESSMDALHWTEKGRVKGSGNSIVQVNYFFKDFYALEGIDYYRLKQTDFDGAYTYSIIKSGVFSGKPGSENPVLTILSNSSLPHEVCFELAGWQSGDVITRIWNLAGGLVSQYAFSVTDEAVSRFQIALPASLPAGIYLLECSGSSLRQVQKLSIP